MRPDPKSLIESIESMSYFTALSLSANSVSCALRRRVTNSVRFGSESSESSGAREQRSRAITSCVRQFLAQKCLKWQTIESIWHQVSGDTQPVFWKCIQLHRYHALQNLLNARAVIFAINPPTLAQK